MIKVMTIVGTRPEIIKLSRVISELSEHSNHVLVHTGQNYDYELNEIFFKELEIKKPDYFLNSPGKTVAETIGNIIAESDKVMEKENPDAILLYGDTNSCLSVISAKRRQIPIFHFEAGNRCFDQRVPEEVNRILVDHKLPIKYYWGLRLTPSNFQLLCGHCNRTKGNRPMEYLKLKIEKRQLPYQSPS